MSYPINSVYVSEIAIKHVLESFEIEDYEGLSTNKEVLENMLKSVEEPRNIGNLQRQVQALVYGGSFLIYTDDILKFLNTLDLNEATLKRVEKNPMETYANILWHAIKRYLKWGYKDEVVK